MEKRSKKLLKTDTAQKRKLFSQVQFRLEKS